MEPIYLVNSASKKLTSVEPVSFSEIGIKERADLEAWVLDNPQVLGESLFVITTEFDRFDRSAKRLDVLALDENGVLVVIELKLELKSTLADQQAIRYAAFCSTMTAEDVVRARALHAGTSEEAATNDITAFLDCEELPELGDRPRIILAGGSLDDNELTATVLWLRKFGLDITCVEITPYRLHESTSLILVPRTIIPIPEARKYMISVERKEIQQAGQTELQARCRELWRAMATSFNSLGTGFTTTGNCGSPYLRVQGGRPFAHYEWTWRKSHSALDAGLHFEWPTADRSLKAIEVIKQHLLEITQGVDEEFYAGPWGRNWAEARFRVPVNGPDATEAAPRSAELMKILIERTRGLVEQIVAENQ